jgi:hypothetical protein
MILAVRHRLTFVCLLVVPGAVCAQRPATIELVPAELAGVVRDTAGNPLRDAEISIPTMGKATRSDAAGQFLLAGIAPGMHEVYLRHIGNISVPFNWTAEEGKRVEIAVTLRPLPHTLDPVVVYSNETRSLSSTSSVAGVVVDSGGIPVPNADLQLIGTSRATVSAADGSFEFRHVPSGTMTLRARHMGFSPGALMIELGNDDHRDVAIRVRRLAQTLDTVTITEESGYGTTDAAWRDFGLREKWRTNSGEAIAIGPKRLSEAGGMPIDLLLRPYTMTMHAARAQREIDPTNGGREAKAPGDPSMGDFACVLENGISPRFVPLRVYSANEIDRIEYYPASPPEREYTGTVVARMKIYPQCGIQWDNSHPAYYVLWLKNAR